MRTSAQHYHEGGMVCWYETGLDTWCRLPYEEEIDIEKGILPNVAVFCPDPDEPGMPEVGYRDRLLIGGDEEVEDDSIPWGM